MADHNRDSPQTSDTERHDVEELRANARASAPPGMPPAPNGGLQAWLQVLGSWVVLADTWGLINTFGVYEACEFPVASALGTSTAWRLLMALVYQNHLLGGHSSSQISWIGSVQGSLLMIFGVVSGPLYDAGYFRPVLFLGLFLVVFGQFMLSLCTGYSQVFLAQGICVGLGMGMCFLPSTALLSQYFSGGRLALAIGIASTGSPVAGIVFPIVFSRLEPRVGFGWATRTIAFILLGLSVVPALVMRPLARVARVRKPKASLDAAAMREPHFLLFLAGCFFAFLTLYVPFFYTDLFAEMHAAADKRGFAPYLVTLLNVGSIFGRVIPGALAGRLGGLRVLVAVTVVSAVLAYCWMAVVDSFSLGGLMAFAVLYGGFSGGIVSLAPSVVVNMTPDLAKVGARMGVTFVVIGIAILIGTPIAGAVLDNFSRTRWLATIGYGAGSLTLGAVFLELSSVLFYRDQHRAAPGKELR